MIAVILDSNALYGDPFLNSGNLKRLIAYSSLDKIDVLISEVVVEEVVNNNRNKIKTTLEKVKGQIKTINDVSGTQSVVLTGIDIEKIEVELRERIEDLVQKGAIVKVPYKNDLLPELMNRALHKIMPFKENKEEFRDSVIWLSIVDYLKEGKFDKAFFISNNSSDYSDPKTGLLHKDLLNDFPNTKLYKNVKEFFSGEKEEINKLIPYEISTELISWASENQKDESEIYSIIRENFFDELSGKVSQVLSSLNVHDLDSEAFDGYVQPYDLDDFWIEDYEVDIDLDTVVVTGQCSTSNYVELYQYNPVHDNSDEKFSYSGEVEVQVTIDFMFYMAPDQDGPYDFDITGIKTNAA